MMTQILGLPLEEALERLNAAGIDPIEITSVSAPRGSMPRGSLRVVRVKENGRFLTIARFNDSVEETEIENI
ncbi:MAG: hypothetical protein IJC48_00575 [Clostridia bacterium]|nr:hypothetical protein [Clostridia bacterium]